MTRQADPVRRGRPPVNVINGLSKCHQDTEITNHSLQDKSKEKCCFLIFLIGLQSYLLFLIKFLFAEPLRGRQ